MILHYETDLQHQTIPVDSIGMIFNQVFIKKSENEYYNPTFDLNNSQINENIKDIQNKNKINVSNYKDNLPYLNLDIKMETGTGKTYVYTKSMYELYKRCGFRKFIIAVPSVAIKAGTYNFLSDPNVQHHFKDACNYNIDLKVIEVKPKPQKKGKKNLFPNEIRDFVLGCEKNTIYVLLVNQQLLTSKKLNDSYESLIDNSYEPFEALRNTRPVLIIDEPHKFKKDNKTFEVIENKLKPQIIIRFGATFPEISLKATKKTKIKLANSVCHDYTNLLYDLTGGDAFKNNLIKGIAKEHIESSANDGEELIRVVSCNNSEKTVNIHYIAEGQEAKLWTLKEGECLSEISEALENVYIDKVTAKSIILSVNDNELGIGAELPVGVFSQTYQEIMLRRAVDVHFETEKENFNRQYKIKTIALFFIDNIDSFESEENPYLKNIFLKILNEKLDKEINNSKNSKDYIDYLKNTKENIHKSYGGYFSRSNDSSDPEVKEKIDLILRDKTRLLDIKNPMRFIFSKWTLKEGWDNPNVFTICKLRSSGSEISKLQEVGRGLRLPVNELGNRITNEQFYLNYIVDFREKTFATKLISELNRAEGHTNLVITPEMFRNVAKSRNKTEKELFIDLVSKTYIDFTTSNNGNYNIIEENMDSLFKDYPEFKSEFEITNKIIDRNIINDNRPVKIRKYNYEKLKDLWEKINEKYLLFFDDSVNNDLEDIVYNCLKYKNARFEDYLPNGIFDFEYFKSVRETVNVGDDLFSSNNISLNEEEKDTGIKNTNTLGYGEFLLQINNRTNIPIKILHSCICKFVKNSNIKLEKGYFNGLTIKKFIDNFQNAKYDRFNSKFSYSNANIKKMETMLSNADGSPKEEVKRGLLGVTYSGIVKDTYLYEELTADSKIEEKTINENVDNVIVYGKIPSKSLQIPIVGGGTYSPDFMYVIEKENGEKILNLIVESKGYDNEKDIPVDEKFKIVCAEKFFESISQNNIKVYYKQQINKKTITELIREINQN